MAMPSDSANEEQMSHFYLLFKKQEQYAPARGNISARKRDKPDSIYIVIKCHITIFIGQLNSLFQRQKLYIVKRPDNFSIVFTRFVEAPSIFLHQKMLVEYSTSKIL